MKAASVKKTKKMIDEEKIDGSVKIESEKKKQRSEKRRRAMVRKSLAL